MAQTNWHCMEAFTNTFKDIRDHPSTALFTAAILAAPVLIGSVLQQAGASVFGQLLSFVSYFFIIWLAFAITLATKQFASSSDPGVGGLLDASASRRLFSFIGTRILVGLMVIAAALIAFIPAFGVGISAWTGANGNIDKLFNGAVPAFFFLALFFGLFVFVGLALMINLRYGLAGVVNALEDISPTQSLRRSNQLLKGRRADVFVLMLLLFGVGLVVALVLNTPAIIVSISGVASSTRPPSALGAFGSGSFLDMFRPRALGPTAALVVGVSTYLTTMVSTVIGTGAVANFYMALRGDEVVRTAAAQRGSLGFDYGQTPGSHGQPYPGQQNDPPRQDQPPWDFTEKDSGDSS